MVLLLLSVIAISRNSCWYIGIYENSLCLWCLVWFPRMHNVKQNLCFVNLPWTVLLVGGENGRIIFLLLILFLTIVVRYIRFVISVNVSSYYYCVIWCPLRNTVSLLYTTGAMIGHEILHFSKHLKSLPCLCESLFCLIFSLLNLFYWSCLSM
jgi:hypothetical protein